MLCAILAMFMGILYIYYTVMGIELSYTQKEIINLIQDIRSNKELEEIKSLLIVYLADRVTREADMAFQEKNYAESVFERWKNEHFRKSA
jgi:hypothetical protein